MSIHRFVQPDSSLTIGRNRRKFVELDKENPDCSRMVKSRVL
nr:hypothetical protein [uncultured Dorea sp.]